MRIVKQVKDREATPQVKGEASGSIYMVYIVLLFNKQVDNGAFGCDVGRLWFLIRHVQALVKGYGGEAVHSDNPRVNPPRPSGDWEVLRDPSGYQISYPEVKRGDSRFCQRREKT